MFHLKPLFYFLFIFIAALFACQKVDEEIISERTDKDYKTENVVLVVIDGPRYSETWGDPEKKLIPYMKEKLSPEGVINTTFYNEGKTKTVPGHSAITTGYYEKLENGGQESPGYPSVFQRWLKHSGHPSEKAWIITSKGKLEALGNCKYHKWKDQYLPSLNCGENGKGREGGYRDDHNTFQKAKEILSVYHPNLVMIHFKEPDYSGHADDWDGYRKGIQNTDSYTYQLWQFLQNDTFYSGKTTLIVTNDHGRHDDGVRSGYTSHGCSCEGCRHINFYAAGPDFKKGIELSEIREQIDIAPTIAELLNVPFPVSKGNVMWELFEDN